MSGLNASRAAVLVVLLFGASQVSAQTAAPQPRVAVAAGAGVALPFHGDFAFTPAAWEADARVRMSRHAWFEVATGEWRHSETTVSTNLPGASPSEFIERAERKATHVMRMVQGNVLFGSTAGRVRLAAGGGVGLLQHVRQSTSTLEGCPASVTCGRFASQMSSASGTVQAVGGADLRITAGASIYGQGRFIVPLVDPGGTEFRLTGGLRWYF